jgi:hypothetical protein
MEQYLRELLDKVCTYLNIEMHELLIFKKQDHNNIDHSEKNGILKLQGWERITSFLTVCFQKFNII